MKIARLCALSFFLAASTGWSNVPASGGEAPESELNARLGLSSHPAKTYSYKEDDSRRNDKEQSRSLLANTWKDCWCWWCGVCHCGEDKDGPVDIPR